MRRISKWHIFFVITSLLFGAQTYAAGAETRKKETKQAQTDTTVKKTTRVDVNTASREELEAIPGIGAGVADAIIAARPIRTVEELKNVQGVGEARFGQLKRHVTVSKTEKVASTPRKKSSETETATPKKTTARTAKVDVNTASKAELESLPGIGSAIAEAILAARPIRNMEDLKAIDGIGEARFKHVKEHLIVRPATGLDNPRARREPPAAGRAPSVQRRSDDDAPKSTIRPGTRININTASQEELEELLGIGPEKAKRIIEGRPYQKPEDIMNVKGIKDWTYDQIREHITVR